ncbi:hypothetical protein MEQU1_002261 [Malassezia equina]|uniref:PLD phosphodiesterase domain-containing protein n=1 Tax=Malassezia equina TaxID=1381935 RepID=A0AAF0EFN7_9BASI|nr:hypothetical protein MEQU1_002261 [Malassezia equina]
MDGPTVPLARTFLEHTVTSHVAQDPSLAPMDVAKKLLSRGGALHQWLCDSPLAERGRRWNWHQGAVHQSNQEPKTSELEYVRRHFGYDTAAQGGPSELYLKLLADAMLSLPANPLSGVVSPQILATTGTVPCSILSTGPHIIQHYYDCIVDAQQEVILLTNYWQLGKNVDHIAKALRCLNQRTADRGGRMIVKLMWDRGPRSLADLFRQRTPVPPSQWAANGLPTQEELSHIQMQVLNYHRPLLGTFHAKLLLVDRLVALINSINIQDRPNLECCIHLEGDIVNAVYDHALLSWGLALHPPLPCLQQPAPIEPPTIFQADSIECQRALSRQAYESLRAEEQNAASTQPIRMRVHLADMVEHMMRARASATDAHTSPLPTEKEALPASVRHDATLWRRQAMTTKKSPSAELLTNSTMRLLGKDSSSRWNVELSALQARPFDIQAAATRLQEITQSLDFANRSQARTLSESQIAKSTGGWAAQQWMGLLDFEPIIYHTPHKPIPMALVNRRPHGRPGHDDIKTPQNAAWLAGFRYAKRHIFVQSPTLNATPVKAAVLAAVRRGVRVELWLDLGFNDKSESMPFQGGTNEQVVSHMYRTLRHEGQGHEKNLEVYWYTGKDMDRPLHAVRKQRNCHVKFASFDGQVAILGTV